MTYLSLREVDDSESGQVTEAVGRVVCETLAATHIDFLQRRAVTCQWEHHLICHPVIPLDVQSN